MPLANNSSFERPLRGLFHRLGVQTSFTSSMTSFFTGSSYGNFPTLSMNFPLPTFPLSALGVHVEYSPVEEVVIKESLYNGVASDRVGEQFRVSPRSDGFFNIGSVEYSCEIFDNDCEISTASYSLGYVVGNPLPADGSDRRLISAMWCNVEQPLASMDENCFGMLLYQLLVQKNRHIIPFPNLLMSWCRIFRVPVTQAYSYLRRLLQVFSYLTSMHYYKIKSINCKFLLTF